MRNASKVNEARNYFYDKYKGSFGAKEVIKAGFDPVEQYIGSYGIEIHAINKTTLQFTITNNTSFKSFFYGIGGSWDGGMMGNYYQRYYFTEKINYSLLNVRIVCIE